MNYNQQPLSPVPPPPENWQHGSGRFPSSGSYQPGRGNLPTPLSTGMSAYGPDSGSKMNMMGRSPHGFANMNMGSPTSTTSGMGMGGPRGPEYRNGPSPPNSDGRLSTSTAVSVNNLPPEVKRRNQQAMEETLFLHYNVIKQFLGPNVRETSGGSGGPPSRAKDKLLRLSSVQFHELSTDVYDELQRRSSTNPNTQPYLPAKPHYHPKRNQARQKLSTLPDQRFQTLAADALFELERRNPQFTGGNINRRGSPASSQQGGPNRSQTTSPLSPVGPPHGFGMRPRGDSTANGMPYQRSLQQNTMVPNKSYLVEDDDESADNISLYGGGKRDTTATKSSASEKLISEYQNKVDDLTKELEIKTAAAALKDDLEKQLKDAQALNDEMQLELEKIKVEKDQHESEAQDLKTQHEQLETMHEDLQNDYETLKSEAEMRSTNETNVWREKVDKINAENRSLRDQVDEQGKVTESVKKEAEGFLAEMRSITMSNSEALRKEEELRKRNETLIDELALWKDRYARVYANNQASENSNGIVQTQPSFRQFSSPDGVIDPSNISSFHHSIDELLRAVRKHGESPELQNQMRSTIAIVRAIIADVDKARLNMKQQALAEKSRSRVSATANNLITAVRNHGHGASLLPVSLVDAAASHLASAVADLVNAVKLRQTNGHFQHDSPETTPIRLIGGLDGVDESSTEGEQSPLGSYFKSDPTTYRTSATESVYSTNTITRPQSHRISTRNLDKALPPIVPSVPTLQPVREPEPVIETKAEPLGASRAEIEQLKNYLEDQTALMTSSIQALVSTIRVSSSAREVGTNLSSVTSTLGAILLKLSQEPRIPNLEPHTAKLVSAHETLKSKGHECDNVKMDGQKWKGWCATLPPVAFGVARELREVLAQLEGGDGHDEFR